jgi:DNA-binding NarL/FixJ family response regulator
MTSNLNLNLKVVLFDSDYYALQAINSYFAWDRRTRVTFYTNQIDELWDYFAHTPLAELPDMIVLDSDHFGTIENMVKVIRHIRELVKRINVICLIQTLNMELIEAAAEAKARAVLLKGDVKLQITWAVCYALEHDFTISASIAEITRDHFNSHIYHAAVLPEQRDYPEMTDRIRQAIKLCVIEGMPAHLAADEMGISLHTIRGYIKEGYRILESYDREEYPTDMTPQERAFMRFTALTDALPPPQTEEVKE